MSAKIKLEIKVDMSRKNHTKTVAKVHTLHFK